MSELGIASRREADEWIAKGWVRVDGRIVAELGSRVLPGQHISVDAKARRQQAGRVTVLLNKPVGYVSGQAEDGYEPAVVLVTPQNQWREDRSGVHFVREHLRSLVPAGRLDIDSVGLLVLTQDGRVAKQLIGEDSDVEKEYLVRVVVPRSGLAPGAIDRLRHGLELDGEALRPAEVGWVNSDQLRFVLKQGKKRQIRRMCEAVGLQVVGLKRVRIGTVVLGELPPGHWRYLRLDEAFAPLAAKAPATSKTAPSVDALPAGESTEPASTGSASTGSTSTESAPTATVSTEASSPEVELSETASQESASSGSVAAETAMPDAATPERLQLETAVPETAAPETAAPEAAAPEAAAPEAAAPETAAPETAALEVAPPDGAPPKGPPDR